MKSPIGLIIVGAFLFSGCSTFQVKSDIASKVNIDSVSRKITITHKDKSVEIRRYHLGSDITIENGILSDSAAGLCKVPLIGWDLTGLEGSPWFGWRFAYLLDLGLDAGFDRKNVTVGIDYNYRELIVGGQLEQPYDGSSVRVGAKVALVF